MGFFGTKAHNIWLMFNDRFDRVMYLAYIIFLFGSPFLVARHVYNDPDNIAGTIALAMILSTVTYIMKSLSEFYAPHHGIPALDRRVTRRDGDFVHIDHDDYYTAMLYLADIEDWMQSNGLTR